MPRDTTPERDNPAGSPAKSRKCVGYARVSTEDQEPAMQISALSAAGCSQIFCDHGASGADRERLELANALESLNKGD